ncbi:uncharacterized protein Z520_05309 [Fonsecaea multimorphosa CBS 102226]|uniref:Trichothecene 3-O-acetyltransferase-like N-terminal domain-containing protein n=1 Tax=Fonsecaea multimorphosa CBS 102226 TaxID=1442371 RepID=A0A0D2KQ64_9EURO|nr:uncharacterized protein Z520_05309 [Fonsecaea multimorphosa CBS 102226]KIX98848.1 hypothetical protein Z520_05309 [Fonsecaea multimorphosa CBS 102226]OAL25128.1 hypothetical protein AYO22_05005 [Fonsecaea multimorphosa]
MRQPGIFGQLCWDTYTIVVLGFRTAADSTPETVTKALDRAALRLLDAYPFLTGQVINEGRSSTSSGTYKIVPYPPHSDGKSPVRPRDCTQLCPSYDEILRAHAPFSMLDGSVICPMRGFGYVYDQTVQQPVLIIQANFVRGGLLLCFASMHNALDMNGQGVMIRQFATAMRGEDFDPQLVAAGNQDADSIVPLLKEGEKALTHDEMRVPIAGPAPPPPPQEQPTQAASWIYWRFPQDKVAELKKLATSGSTKPVSTNDAITAFYTQRLTAVRIAGGRVSRDESIRCLRAVDARAKLNPPVPKGYLGHLVGLAYTEWPVAGTVAESPLSTVASDIRQSLQKVDDHYIRSLATLVTHAQDKRPFSYGARKQLAKDIFISSWAQLDLAQTCDFGPVLGGKPDFVRRAKMDLLPDLAYMMPKDKQGDMALGACLFKADIDGLESDEVWTRYARYVG